MKISKEKLIYSLELSEDEYYKFRQWEKDNKEKTNDHLWNFFCNISEHFHEMDNWGHTLSIDLTFWYHPEIGKTITKIKRTFTEIYLKEKKCNK